MKPIDAAGLAGLLRPGMTVFVPGQHASPRALIAALDAHPGCTSGVHVISARVPGFDDPPPRVPGGRLTVFFRTPDLDAVEGEVRFVPIQYRRLWDLLAGLDLDLVLCRVRPPDALGRCGWGPGLDFLPAVLPRARRVVAQVDASLPAIAGGAGIDAEEIHHRLDAESPTATRNPRDDEVSRAIGARVAELIDDGDCLQTGIGAIPDATLMALRDRRALGCHSGLITDGVLELIASGALDGSRKSIDRGRVVTGFLLGSKRLYQWAERAVELDLRPVSYTHDARVLASLERLVAINSAVEVDLLGQVNGEIVGGRQISGTGGAVDFLRGAALSPGGRSVVALPATASGGRRSRIVARLGARSVATATRTDADAVVTEHGVARLRGASVEERVERLIAVAAPEHRQQLRDEQRRLESRA
ncbi:MAG TPA: acetyl-CoA hydrolase/transferase C-terminal domain-containing protein [Thermoanaerobaculia bacterium]|nr:acetyl-CoA hydrolase/transferase C-terminal domain-containing protein [Thermoanaerobaculia bacterium]